MIKEVFLNTILPNEIVKDVISIWENDSSCVKLNPDRFLQFIARNLVIFKAVLSYLFVSRFYEVKVYFGVIQKVHHILKG